MSPKGAKSDLSDRLAAHTSTVEYLQQNCDGGAWVLEMKDLPVSTFFSGFGCAGGHGTQALKQIYCTLTNLKRVPSLSRPRNRRRRFRAELFQKINEILDKAEEGVRTQ